ncbi:transglycosylase SLT domain-containing protein [Tumidithrix elongata RA019]|uniref:Transglycosylase SLT domain-containing protein n=1 Tax=Tumidithrix elongata BACA0141 TaxID=2716417 RepID=A0AAW9PVS5_9CYAN|nr:transglycosylase SLT domain-containing protein [Tumidithrix elongata RA019]
MNWSIAIALSATLAGSSAPLSTPLNSELNPNSSASASSLTSFGNVKPFDPLTFLPYNQRIAQLELKAKASEASLERSRSRLALANIYLDNKNPRAALAALEGLETEYPLLAEYVLLKRAQAFTQANNGNAARAVWNQILTNYANSPVAAEAMFMTGQTQQLLQKLPSHPRALGAALMGLSQNPQRADLLAHIAVYFNEYKAIVPLLDRLVNSGAKLTPDQWWAVADAYYDNFEFNKSANAYLRATPNAFTAYRLGRSFHRGKQIDAALGAYNRVAQQYAQSPEAPRALIRIMQIADPSQAVAVADRIVANYPDTAAEALLKKADLLQDKLGSPQAASAARNLLLSRFANSNEAGEIYWRIAKGHANAGDLKQAIASVQILTNNAPDSAIAAEASFWGGKWATRIGDRTTSRQLFEFAIRKHPESYFAWRSASYLGWPVGDLGTARNVNLPFTLPSIRTGLPAGSPQFQELYILGMNQDASDRWQYETRGKRSLTPREIFTDGVIRVGVNDNLLGIRKLESLDTIDVNATERADIKMLQQQPIYWQSLYPFPYWNSVANWSRERQISPLLVLGLMRQESRFEAQILSRSGAVGLMQIMPDTGQWIASKKGVSSYSLSNPEDNINFGTWYLDYTHRSNNNNSMLAVASYNAGPGAIGRWVESRGLGDPDDFVNNIPYDETRGYVERVFSNYWNYLRLYAPQVQQQITQLQSSSGNISGKRN